jgi:hypothetical protein
MAMTRELCEPDLAASLPSGLDFAREVGVLRGRKELAGEARFEGETELAEKMSTEVLRKRVRVL